jgi:hypothetical protein
MIDARDDARRSFVQAADTFLSRLRSEAFQESHEAAVHVIGPLQHAADQLGSIPVLGPTALGEQAEALHEEELEQQREDEEDDGGSSDDDDDNFDDDDGSSPRKSTRKQKKKKKASVVAPEAPALAAFDRWIAENTAGTVGTKTEEAVARLLSCVTATLM